LFGLVDIKKIAAEKGLKIGKPSIIFFSLMICEEKLVSEFIGISHNESINLFLKKIKLQRELSLARRIVFIIPYSCFVKSYRDRLKPMMCDIFTACSIAYKYCTRPIIKHLYSGIFKDPLNRKHKLFKKKTEFINIMFHV